jgi:hypothetical protein
MEDIKPANNLESFTMSFALISYRFDFKEMVCDWLAYISKKYRNVHEFSIDCQHNQKYAKCERILIGIVLYQQGYFDCDQQYKNRIKGNWHMNQRL